MYCVDTNIVVDIMRGDKALAIKVENMIFSGKNIFLTPITLCELYRGAFLHVNFDKKLQETESIIFNFEFIDFNAQSCKVFGELYAEIKKSGKMISDFDLMIASICKANNLILVTRDKKHFKNTKITIEEW
ncbi:MAG: type II toxin-antitoxin system VapC family toxin [Nanoarchaeota archaeon]